MNGGKIRLRLEAKKALSVVDDSTHIEVSVYYSKGGLNYATYKQEARGYYISMKPVEVDGNIVKYDMFSGVKFLVEEVGRLNKKKLDALYQQTKEQIKQRQGDYYNALIRFAEEKSLQLSPDNWKQVA